MGRAKKKPYFNSNEILKELTNIVANTYLESGKKQSLRALADEFELNPIKIRKLLITAGVYDSELAEEIQYLYRMKKSAKTIAQQLQISVASVNSYLPYTKAIYNAKELSVTAERVRKYRERKGSVESLQKNLTAGQLWKTIVLFEGYGFRTSRGLRFTYSVKGNELFVNRKEKSITYSSVVVALDRVLKASGNISGPRKLHCFGASYLYSIFQRFGLIHIQSDCILHEAGVK